MANRNKSAVLCLLFVFINLINSFDINDLKRIKEGCYEMGSCDVHDPFEMNCSCDDDCYEYGDCCLDAKSRMKNTSAEYECVASVYMKGKCIEGWSSPEVDQLCKRASPARPSQDPFFDTPVTSSFSNVTYTNYYCAVCNNETLDNLEAWQVGFRCRKMLGPKLMLSYEEENLIEFDGIMNISLIDGRWNVVKDNEFFERCRIEIRPKRNLSSKLRQCKGNVISTCLPDWTDTNIATLCESYTTVVYQWDVRFKNYHCAICNHVESHSLECSFNEREGAPSPFPFHVLFDFGDKHSECESGEILNPFSQSCRPVVCLKNNFEFKEGRCVKIINTITKLISVDTPPVSVDSLEGNVTDHKDNSSLKCDKIFFNNSEFIRNNDTAEVNAFGRKYKIDEYETENEGIWVCIPDSYSSLMGWLTFVGLGLSCVCIIIHLIVFLLVPELRNLPGKNLASMCLALLIAFICFLVAGSKKYRPSETNSCSVLASVMYFFFFASFSWMNVIAFDTWRALRMANSKLRLRTGKQWKTFIFYSLYAWICPLLALIVVLTIDYSKPSWIDHSYLPELGKFECWFGQKRAILVYFATPLALIMLLNIIFFVMSAKTITLASRLTANLSRPEPNAVHFKLYLRLALLMGLTWISGIIAGYLQNEYVWYLYIVLNTFQGLFILVAFTCRTKVLKALKTKYYLKLHKSIQTSKTDSTNLQEL